MSVTSTQATSLLQNVLFESSTLAAATAGGYVTLSAINPLASTVAGLATVLSGSAEASIAEQVVRYYQGALGRAPSATEVAYYVNIAEAGLTSAQIQQGASAVSGTTWNTIAGYFVASPEFTNDFANNGSAIVELLYLNILGRNPSATEVAYYNAQLAQGFTNVNLVQEFTNSPEYISKTTTNIANSLANNGLAVVNGTTQGLITALTSSTGGGTTNSTYTLTTGVDIASANQFVGSLASYSATGIGPTLTIGDSLTGTGSNPTLLLTDSYNTSTSDIIPSGITLTNIATVSLTTSGNAGSAGQSFDTSPYSSVTNTVVNSSGGGNDYVKAASTSAVAVTHNSTAGNVTVYGGGTTIAVTTNSAGTATTNPNNTITYSNVAIGGTGTNQLAAATTAISLTENGSGAGAATSTVYGGAAVTVNVNTNTASGNTTIGNSSLAASTKALNPSGLITLTSVSTFGSTNIDKIYGGGSAGVTATIAGDTLTIGDAAATTATNTTTGAVTVTDALATGYNGTTAATAGGAIDVNTTGAVTVTTNAGSTVTVGATGQSGAENPAAAVTITDTSGDHSGGFNTGTFGGGTQATIFGGTAVTVTEAGGGVSIGSATASDDPTGAVTVSETAFSLQTISVDGGSSVTVNANGQAVNIGTKSGTTGLDTVNETGVYTGQGLGSSITASAITVDGGGTAGVVVNTTGGNVTVGSSSITNGLTTGAVTINNTFSGINTSNASTVTVLGGGAVTITEANTTSGAISVGAQATLNSAGASVSNLTSDPTGNVTINNSAVEGSVTSYGTSAVTVITNGGTTVSVTGASSATINDANDITASSGSAAGTSTLTTVNLDGVLGAVQLDGGLITNVAISDSFNGAPAATRVTLNGGTNPSTGVSYANEAAHTAILTLSNDSNALTSYTDSTASAITVNTSGTAKDSITLIGAKAATLNFNNTAALTVPAGDTVLSTGAVIKVTGSGSLNLGNVAGWTSATGVTSITDTGTGAVTATINGSNTSFSGGTGANIISVTTGNNGSITGGGNAASEVILNNTASTYASSLNSGNIAIKSDFTGFGILGLIGASVTGTYDVSGFNSVVLGADGTTPGTNTGLSLINLASGEQVSMTGVLSQGVTLINKSYNGTTDSATLAVGGNATAFNAGTVTFNTAVATKGVETISINSTANTSTTSGFNQVTLTEQAASISATTLNVSGSQNITINDTTSTKLATITVTNSGSTDLTGITTQASAGITITGGAGFVYANTFTSGSVATSSDTITSGAGGLQLTVGQAGSYTTAATLGAGSESVNLSASTAVQDTIIDHVGVTTLATAVNGARPIISGFSATSATTSDVLKFSEAVTVVGNNTTGITVTNNNGGLTNTFTVSNGVFTRTSGTDNTGVDANFQQVELQEVQYLVEGNITQSTNASGANFTATIGGVALTAGTAIGAAGDVGAVQIGNATYVIASYTKGTPGFTGGVATVSAGQDGAADTVFALSGVTGITGFGPSSLDSVAQGAGNTVLLAAEAGNNANGNVAPAAAAVTFTSKASAGTATAGTTSNWLDSGYAHDSLSVGGLSSGETNNFTSLGAWAILDVGTAGANAQGSVVTTTQVGTSGTNELVINGLVGGTQTVNLTVTQTTAALTTTGTTSYYLDSFTASGDIRVDFDVTNSGYAIKSFIDGTNTATTFQVAGAAGKTLYLGAITDTALTTIDASKMSGVLDIGAGTGTPLSQAGLTIKIKSAGTLDAFTTGAGDTITGGNSGDVIVASGAKDTITDGTGNNNITANGAGDTITVGNTSTAPSAGTDNIFTTGAGDTIKVYTTGAVAIDGGTTSVGIGLGDSITVVAGNSTTVYVIGDATGATSATVAAANWTTINGAAAGNGLSIYSGNATTEKTAGTTLANSQVNVASATSLANAFDIAAAADAASQGSSAKIAANTGVLDWFQYGGNTYLVEAVNNSTTASATHTTLGTHDVIIELAGIVNLTGSVANGTFNAAGASGNAHTIII